MRRAPMRSVLTAALSIALTGCAAVTGAPNASRPDPGGTATSATREGAWTEERVQSELMSFADRFASRLVQEAYVFEDELDTPEARRLAAGDKLYVVAAAWDIAAGPDPGVGLLDMAILIRLKRIVWDQNYRETWFGDDAERIVRVYREFEQEIWTLLESVYTKEQIEDLAELVEEWRNEHPGQISVAFMRLGVFAESRRAAQLRDAGKPGGVLAPVRAANLELYELRRVAERATYLVSRLPLLVQFHTELAYSELVLRPEVRLGLRSLDQLPGSLDRVASALDRVEAVVPDDPTALIEEALAGLRAERESIFEELERPGSGPRATLADLRATLEATDRTVVHLQEMLASLERLWPAQAEGDPDELPDLAELGETVVRARDLVVELRALVGDVGPLLARVADPASTGALPDLLDRWRAHVDAVVLRLFLAGVGLIVLTLVAALAYRRIIRSW